MGCEVEGSSHLRRRVAPRGSHMASPMLEHVGCPRVECWALHLSVGLRGHLTPHLGMKNLI
jgi:hypothetical protein